MLDERTRAHIEEWSRMRDLVRDLAFVWERFRADLQAFLDQQKEQEDSGA